MPEAEKIRDGAPPPKQMEQINTNFFKRHTIFNTEIILNLINQEENNYFNIWTALRGVYI